MGRYGPFCILRYYITIIIKNLLPNFLIIIRTLGVDIFEMLKFEKYINGI